MFEFSLILHKSVFLTLGSADITIAQIRRQGQNYCHRLLIKGPCECHICSQQYREQMYQKRSIFGYTKVLSDDEARRKAADMVNTTRANFQYLREQCEKNGAVIVKRWKKRSSEKRKALLLEVDPKLYPYQWADIRFLDEFTNSPEWKARDLSGLLLDPDTTQGRARRPFRTVCLLPFLNLASLKDDPARLLNLLYNRVKFTPEQWVPYDNYLLDKQWQIGSLATVYNKNCIVMHGPSFGKLTSWQSRSAHAWDIVGYPRAILVLEAQLKLSEVLMAVVEKLLVGHESGNNTSNLNEALDLGMRKATDNSSCVEFASVFINQPFSAPPTFDIKSLLAIAEAQVNLHADHLWLLQIDPLSLRRYVNLVIEGTYRETLTIHNQNALGALKLMEDSKSLFRNTLSNSQSLQIIYSEIGLESRLEILTMHYSDFKCCLQAILILFASDDLLHLGLDFPRSPEHREIGPQVSRQHIPWHTTASTICTSSWMLGGPSTLSHRAGGKTDLLATTIPSWLQC